MDVTARLSTDVLAPVFLASVRTPEEARQALSGGAGIIDCKDPEKGALGALTSPQIHAIVKAISERVLVSATIGDLPSDGAVMVKAARAVAATGADIVKVGFFGDGVPRDAIAALGSADIGRAKLVAVLMADKHPDFGVIAALADAGFAGVMLDTADKSSGALPDVLDSSRLSDFIARARASRLMAGLAGSLRAQHIAGLVALRPDVIGFRGALCDGGRTGQLDPARVQGVRDALDAAIACLSYSEGHFAKRSVA